MQGGANLRICNFTNFVEIFADAINITLNVHDYHTKKICALNLRLEVDPRNIAKNLAPQKLGALYTVASSPHIFEKYNFISLW